MIRFSYVTLTALATAAACTRGEPARPASTAAAPTPVADASKPLPDPDSLLEEVFETVEGPAAAVMLSLSEQPRLLASIGRNGLDPFTSTFRPGSTVKPLLAVLAAERSLLPPRHEVDCTGTFAAAPDFTCFDTHGPLDLRDALMLSCNSYFFDLAHDVGHTAIHDGFAGFGFGSTTGLASSEVRGLLPENLAAIGNPPGMAENTLALNIGVGHGPFEVTLAQLASAYARLAKRLNELPDPERSDDRTAVMAEIAGGLRDVVQQPRGTGSAAAVPGQCVAGKTGTAEAWSWDASAPEPPTQNGLFVGFAPATDPTVVIAVVVTGGTGGSRAAPVAGKILERWFLASEAPPQPCPPEEGGPPC